MKLRIDFGHNGARREVTWWQPLEDFPTGLIFNGERWEWLLYDNDVSGQYDKVLTYTHMKRGDPRWYDCVDFDQRFGYSGRTGCECGAIHTSFPQFHMFFCPQWRKS